MTLFNTLLENILHLQDFIRLRLGNVLGNGRIHPALSSKLLYFEMMDQPVSQSNRMREIQHSFR
jgi:hypothetical protein